MSEAFNLKLARHIPANPSVCQEPPGHLRKLEMFIPVSGKRPRISYFQQVASPYKFLGSKRFSASPVPAFKLPMSVGGEMAFSERVSR